MTNETTSSKLLAFLEELYLNQRTVFEVTDLHAFRARFSYKASEVSNAAAELVKRKILCRECHNDRQCLNRWYFSNDHSEALDFFIRTDCLFASMINARVAATVRVTKLKFTEVYDQVWVTVGALKINEEQSRFEILKTMTVDFMCSLFKSCSKCGSYDLKFYNTSMNKEFDKGEIAWTCSKCGETETL